MLHVMMAAMKTLWTLFDVICVFVGNVALLYLIVVMCLLWDNAYIMAVVGTILTLSVLYAWSDRAKGPSTHSHGSVLHAESGMVWKVMKANSILTIGAVSATMSVETFYKDNCYHLDYRNEQRKCRKSRAEFDGIVMFISILLIVAMYLNYAQCGKYMCLFSIGICILAWIYTVSRVFVIDMCYLMWLYRSI